MSNVVLDHYRAEFARTAARLAGARLPWIGALRAGALEQFAQSGLPAKGNEDWKYTDVAPVERHRFTLAEHAAGVTPAIPEAPWLSGETGAQYRLVFVDGHLVDTGTTLRRPPRGLYLRNLAVALHERPTEIEAHLGRLVDGACTGFAALNTALFTDGVYLHLAHGTVLDGPIELVYVSSGRSDGTAQIRNLLVADSASRADIVETYVGQGPGAYLTNALTEIVLGSGAHIDHYKLEREASGGYHVENRFVEQSRDSRYMAHNLSGGARLARNQLEASLDGEGAECILNGLYLARDRQHVDTHTLIHHRKARGTSREWYKGILDARARGVFSGRIVVHPDAQHTDAEQSNHNLLLSEHAEADSRPQLEIYADDVKCSHGATVGQLDEDALFYLRSRGLDEARARKALIYAFASDVLNRIGLAPLRARLERELATRLLPGGGAQRTST